MKLHEYQSKQLFAKYGIPIPKGEIATTPEDARRIARDLGRRVVIKSQVLVGGRGKAGGVKLANTPDEAEIVAGQILGMNIKGLTVRKVLVDEAADIAQEIYLGIVLDRLQRRAVMMASAAGGMDIEEVARETPEKIIRVAIDPFLGLREYQTRQIAYGIGLKREMIKDFNTIAQGLYRCFVDLDASLAEINPLVITGAGVLQALDGKILVDDNALLSPSRSGSAARCRRRSAIGNGSAPARPVVHQTRRRDRLHGQRRGSGDGDDGHDQVVRRQPGELPGYWRRRSSR